MGDVIPNTRFDKKTPAQRDRLRRKFAPRPTAAQTRGKPARSTRDAPRRRP